MTVSNNVVPLVNRNTKDNGCHQCVRRPLCLAKSLIDEQLSEFDDLIIRSRPLQRRQSLCSAGDKCDRLYIVRSGTFKSYRLQDDGSLHVTGFHFPGDLMGTGDISAGVRRDYIESLETGSVCELTLPSLERISSSLPSVMMQLIGDFAAEINREKNIGHLLCKMSVDQKVANYLVELADSSYRSGFPKNTAHLSMTRNDLANYLGMAGETISRVLHRLHEHGLIDNGKKTIEITLPEALVALARDGDYSSIHAAVGRFPVEKISSSAAYK